MAGEVVGALEAGLLARREAERASRRRHRQAMVGQVQIDAAVSHLYECLSDRCTDLRISVAQLAPESGNAFQSGKLASAPNDFDGHHFRWQGIGTRIHLLDGTIPEGLAGTASDSWGVTDPSGVATVAVVALTRTQPLVGKASQVFVLATVTFARPDEDVGSTVLEMAATEGLAVMTREWLHVVADKRRDRWLMAAIKRDLPRRPGILQ